MSKFNVAEDQPICTHIHI